MLLNIYLAGYSYQEARHLTEMYSELKQMGGLIKRTPFAGYETFEELQDFIQSTAYSLIDINPKVLKNKRQRRICLIGPESYDNYLQRLPPLKNVIRFNFIETTITNETIKHLLKQDDLMSISFSACTITANNFEELKKLKKFDNLELHRTIIPNKIFENDLPIINMKFLLIQKCPISSNNIDQIKRLKKLKSLNIYEVKLSDKIILDLKKALPECEINYELNW